MAESPFAPMDPITQGLTPDEIMMLIQQRQLAQPGAYMPEMPQSPFEAAEPMPAPTADMPFEGNNLPPGSSDMASGKRFEDMLTAPAKTMVGQFDKAGEAGKDFLVDPSIPNAANAGVQTGAALMRPGMMLGSAAIGVGDALLKDVGGISAAEANGKGGKSKLPPAPGSEEEFRWAQDRIAKGDFRSGAERRDLEGILSRYRDQIGKGSESQMRLEEERKRAGQEEYDRKTRRADEVYQTEMGRDRRWSDTATGKFMDKMGGLDPFIAAMGAGGAVGKIQKMTGGHATSLAGKVGQELSPFVAGTAAAFGVNNIPDAYNATKLEPDNPKKRALEGRGMELPVGHPDKQASLDAAAPMPDRNPIRESALSNLTDPKVLAGRLGYSAMEGLGSPVAAGLVRGRGPGASSGAGAGKGATTPAPSPSLPPGGPQAALPPPQTVSKAVGAQKPGDIVINAEAARKAAQAHREAMAKHRGDPETAAFFEANKDLGPRQMAAAWEAQFGPMRPKSIMKLKDQIGKDTAAKGVDDARAQLAETARTAQGDARMVWDSIAQGGNGSYRDVKTIMPEIRAAFPALKDMTDKQLGNFIKKAARGQ